MAWTVLYDEDFASWLDSQPSKVRVRIAAKIGVLVEFGPSLGRPSVDTVYGSAYDNMKELRVKAANRPYRVLFAFDPGRNAILLLGGDKAGDKRWYEVNLPIADERYGRHLRSLDDRPKGE